MKLNLKTFVKKAGGLAVVVFALLFAARYYVIRKLDAPGGLCEGVQTTIAKFEADREIVSSRVRAVTEASLRDNSSEAAEVFALMGDTDLNRLALLYMGADWAIPRDAFQGRVRALLKSGRNQMDERTKRAERCQQAMTKLERRRRLLQMSLNAPSASRKARRELSDLEREIADLKSSKDYVELIAPNTVKEANRAEKARVSDEISRLTAEYRRDSVERLEIVINESLAKQKEKLALLDRRNVVYRWLDFWPLTKLVPRDFAQRKRNLAREKKERGADAASQAETGTLGK